MFMAWILLQHLGHLFTQQLSLKFAAQLYLLMIPMLMPMSLEEAHTTKATCTDTAKHAEKCTTWCMYSTDTNTMKMRTIRS